MSLTVGIIGGAGRMGSYFADIFSNANYDVLISDVDKERLEQMGTKGYRTLNSEEVASLSDLLVFSVPITDTPKVIRDYAPLVKGKGKGISDLTSTKVEPILAMLEASNPEVEVIGMHPMFAPAVDMEGQKVVLVPVRPREGVWTRRLEKVIEDNGASYFHTTPEKHDYYMSLVQGLPHAIQFIAAETLRTLGVDLSELSRFSSKFYDMFFHVLWRVFAMNNPELYGQIQMGNPSNQKVLRVMEDIVRRHRAIIGKETIDEFIELYTKGREFLGEYAEIAKRETSPFVGKPLGVPIYYNGVNKSCIEAVIEGELPVMLYKEWLFSAQINQGQLAKIIRRLPFARYTVYKRKERGPLGSVRKEGTYAFYVSNRKHPLSKQKGVVFSPIVPMDPVKEETIHLHHVRIQMRNSYSDPWLNLFQTWKEHPELHEMGILIAGQTKGIG